MRVSVVTPTLNSESWIEECVTSVLSQATADIEVEHVVADGGSSDRTVEIARRLGATIVPREPTDPLPAVLNKATLASTGRLVGTLGSDDVLLPGAIRAIVDRYRSSGRRWITGRFVWTDADLRPIGSIAPPPTWMTAEMMASLGWCPISAQSTFLERSLFEELGGHDLTFPTLSDQDLFFRAMETTPFAREKRSIAYYRRRGDNLSIVSTTMGEENQRILDAHGPGQLWKQRTFRILMKLYINGRNPVWAYNKVRSQHRH